MIAIDLEIIRQLDEAGYVIVPKEPTREMLIAADEAYEESVSDPDADAVSIEMYRAMVKAAQTEGKG